MIKKAICIAGKISAGKSTFSKLVQEISGYPIISFGKYLVSYSEQHNLPIERDDLQNLGNKMIEDNSSDFLQNVLQFSNLESDTIIIEGVRHKSIWNEIQKISLESTLIFVDSTFDIRYTRYIKRRKPGDEEVSKEKFFEIDSHQVESEIDELKLLSSFVVNADEPFSEKNVSNLIN